LVRRRPGLLLAYANVDQLRGRLGSTAERLQAATTLLDLADPERPPPEEAAGLRAQADDLTALIHLYRGDGAGAVEEARRALPHASDRRSFLGGDVRMLIGLGLHLLGQHAEALRFLGQDADADAAGESSPREMYALALIHLAAGDHTATRYWAARLL